MSSKPLTERERYLQRLEALTPLVLERVEALPGLQLHELREQLRLDPRCDELVLAFLSSTVLQLWDAGEVKITTERGLVRCVPG